MHPSRQPAAQETNNKEPWLAVNLSRLLPGIGQIYAQKVIKGWLILVSHVLLVILGGWLLLQPTGNAGAGIAVLTIGLLVLPVWNLFDAHATARSQNSGDFEAARKQTKDAWLAVFLSGFLPGLGHAYLRQGLSSLFFIAIFLVSLIAAGSPNPGVAIVANLFQIVFVFVTFYHVYVSTPVRRERSLKTIQQFIAAFVGVSVILSAVLAGVIRQFVAEARYIPSGAMIPTLQVNDRLIINKLTYRFDVPKRGDIVVFSPTQALRQQNFHDAFIKRIVGLPGEKVQVRGGRVYVNDQPLREPYISEAPQYTWGPQVVPPDSYFVLGDNRNNSYDSHYWGFVPRQNLIGKATQRFFPFERSGSLNGK